MTRTLTNTAEIRVHDRRGLEVHLGRWEAFVARRGTVPLSYHPAWLKVLERGLRQVPYCLEAVDGNRTLGLLPLTYLNTRLFGRFLVGLPYLNYGGAMTDDEATALRLIDRAVELADQLDVRHLELRHERAVDHPALVQRPGSKVHMQLPLPATTEELWKAIPSKVRNQVRKGQKSELTIAWGGEELLPEFYAVFSENMRDLGTPVFSRSLFRSALRRFRDRAEFCVVRIARRPAAAALLLHGWGVTEVPSASSLRRHNNKCANMLMYFSLLERAVSRGQETFDFGRSSPESSTYQFKRQWGAAPSPAAWQYYVRSGNSSDMRPDNPRFHRLIRIWQRLPLGLTRLIGPPIVRGIP